MSVKPGEDEQEQECRHHGADRQRDRDARRDDRAEDDHQDDERRQQAEQLLDSLFDRRELRVSVELGLDARRRNRGAHRVLDRDHLITVLRLDRLRELRLRIGDAAVVRERVVAEGIADALDPGLVGGGLELVRLQLRDRAFDRRLPLGRVEALTPRGGEDEIQNRALLLRELALDQVGRLLGVRARDLELVLEAPADRSDEHDEEDDDPHPARDHAPRVGRARTHPARERPRREPFVRRPPLTISAYLLRHASCPLCHLLPTSISQTDERTRTHRSSPERPGWR